MEKKMLFKVLNDTLRSCFDILVLEGRIGAMVLVIVIRDNSRGRPSACTNQVGLLHQVLKTAQGILECGLRIDSFLFAAVRELTKFCAERSIIAAWHSGTFEASRR